MKLEKNIFRAIIAILAIWLSGCDSKTVRVTPLGDNYEEVVYVRSHISAPEAHTITLQFRNVEGKQVMVWPSLESATVVKNGVAMFVASRTDGSYKKDGIWPMESRLFAVSFPGLPMDITDETVGRWAQESGKDAAKYLEDYPSPIEPQETNGNINTEFEFTHFQKIVISLSWEQISNIMECVKTNGVQHKDPQWNLIYIDKEFKPGMDNKLQK
jgi:hypothetical protein